MKHERLVVTHDLWTEASLIAAVLFTGLVIGIIVGHALWGDLLEQCLGAADLPGATCEALFEGGR